MSKGVFWEVECVLCGKILSCCGGTKKQVLNKMRFESGWVVPNYLSPAFCPDCKENRFEYLNKIRKEIMDTSGD